MVGEFGCGIKSLSSPFKRYGVPHPENIASEKSHGACTSLGVALFQVSLTVLVTLISSILREHEKECDPVFELYWHPPWESQHLSGDSQTS